MKTSKPIFLILLIIILLTPSLTYSQTFSKDERKILELQDTRSLGNNKELLKYLESKDEKIVNRVLIALTNIQDTSVAGRIADVLKNSKSESNRKNAAFALGQINSSQSLQFLFNFLVLENSKPVLAEIIKSIGLTGDESSLNKLTELKSTDDEINAAIALAIARFAYRKVLNENSVIKLKELINSTDQWQILRYSSYALARIPIKPLMESVRSEIIKLTQQDHPETRMWAYVSLGRLKDAESLKYLLTALDRESEWKIKVNILNAIGNTDKANITDSLMTILFNTAEYSNTSVSMIALNVIGRLLEANTLSEESKNNAKGRLQWYLTPDKAIDWQIKSEAVKTYAKIFRDDSKDDLMSYYSTTTNYNIKADIIRSFSNMTYGVIYKEVRDSINVDVQRYNSQKNITSGEMISGNELAKLYKAFVELVYNVSSNVDDENKNSIRLILSEFLSSRDPAIVDICLSGLKDSVFIKYRAETSQILLFDYNELRYPEDSDIMQMYIQSMGELKVTEAKELLEKNLKSDNYDLAKASADALQNITGNNYESKLKANKYKKDFDWKFIETLSKRSVANIKTNRGSIKIALDIGNAAFTVQSFVKLADKHYFDNLIFHRVIPNFVIQGGDPTGTGYSGPGYTLRTEITQAGFEPYTMGMASSGKDTEGSQFFITHSSQPHLDTKYTVFGKVIEGQEVVDGIQIDDYIESITFSGK